MSQNDSLLEVYIFENLQLLEQLEMLMLTAEKAERFTEKQVDAIFRILHTIKGSSGMMSYDGLARLSHAMEDLFSFIRDNKSKPYHHRKVCDLVFAAQDFLKSEVEKLQEGVPPASSPQALLDEIAKFHRHLKSDEVAVEDDVKTVSHAAGAAVNTQNCQDYRHYKVQVVFEPDCKMENVRAFGIVKSVEALCSSIVTVPEDVLKVNSDDFIIENGFTLFMESASDARTLKEKIAANFFIASLTFEELVDASGTPLHADKTLQETLAETEHADEKLNAHQNQSYMSVRLEKLDKLMDLVGEIVITETTVTKNPEVSSMHIDSFEKASRQLRKLTDELQDTVMSIRMIQIGRAHV